jgi:signal transduction histidine kinase
MKSAGDSPAVPKVPTVPPGSPEAGARAAASAPASNPARARGIDWSQLWYPGPKRAFTADEMARAGSDAPSPTFVAVAAINIALVAFAALQVSPPALTARLTALLVALAALGVTAARWLWWRPWRRPLMWASAGMGVFLVAMALGMRWRVPSREERLAIHWVLTLGAFTVTLLLWFLVVWRAQQIEARLAEQAERQRAIEMAQRLASAQVAPHFLFNTLASLQHWVHTQDPRAATLLDALTGYLRATLPMFSRALHPAADELHAVRLYLQVMQARLGARLVWHIDVDPALLAQTLPPGLLLTLVENAIEHGIDPQLAGGQLWLRGRRDGAQAVFEVQDNGPGPAPGSRDGIGLSNSRERLALACGGAARLDISAAAEGGCLARVTLPA